MTINWTPPTDNGGAIIQGYEVWYKTAVQDETFWTLIGTVDLNTLVYIHTGLSGTDDVQYKIRALSNKGNGAFSVRNTFILASTPTISTAPIKLSSSKYSITVSWGLTSNGGSPVLGYKLY